MQSPDLGPAEDQAEVRFLWIKQEGAYRSLKEGRFRSLGQASPSVGDAWSGQVVCFKTKPLTGLPGGRLSGAVADCDRFSPDQADAFWHAMAHSAPPHLVSCFRRGPVTILAV